MDINNEENSQAIQNVRRYEKIDIIIVYVEFKAMQLEQWIYETIYYVWDNKVRKIL